MKTLTRRAARRAASRKAPVHLFERVVTILEEARSRVVRAVNSEMVAAYWLIGREIVEALQGGDARASYGARILAELSQKLTRRYGNGFSLPNLRMFRQFYLAYPAHPPGASAQGAENATPRVANLQGLEFPVLGAENLPTSHPAFHPSLSWSHYRVLMRVQAAEARAYYEEEAVAGAWSNTQLARQIGTRCFERLRMKGAARRGGAHPAIEEPRAIDTLKDPYVLEFLDLPDDPALHESALETAIIANLQSFLLELGKGFSFVARQKRLRFEEQDFYVDLVFYNYLIRCFVLVELKVGQLTHQDIGQMDGYVRLFDAHEKLPGDRPTVGLILCSEENAAVARYSVLHESQRICAATYLTFLPTEEELQRELRRQRRLIEEHHRGRPSELGRP